MNDSDFEQSLSRLPLRPPPAAWRDEILGTIPQPEPEPAWTWRDWLWPSPFAWGALAAVWVAVLANGSNGHPRAIAGEDLPPIRLRVGENERLFAFQFGRNYKDLTAALRR